MNLLCTRRRSFDQPPVLTFAPLAWLKLQFFCHKGDTEIGGFGISASHDLLYIEEFCTVRQEVTAMCVRFADASVADFFDSCVDRGLAPARFGRVWLHTHPGASVTPSWTDEETFARAFGSCDWAVMFILGRTAQTHARLAFSAGPGGQILIPTQVDWSAWPKLIAGQHSTMDAHFAKWQEEYAANIRMWPDRYVDPFARPDRTIATPSDANWIDNFDPWAIEDLYHDYFSDDGASGHAAARDCAAGTAG